MAYGECECGYRVHFVCLHVGRRCEYSFACMRVGNICLCICVLVVYVYVSGRALDSASLIILVDPTHHHALPVEDAAGALVIFSRRAGCSGERRPTLGGRLAGPGPTGLAGPRLWGGGLWVSGPRARSALGWSAAGGACGLAATAPWGAYTVAVGGPAFGLSSALFWVEAAVVPAVVLLGGPVPWGSLDVWGPGLFRACFMPCGMGLLFPTHTIKHLHGGTL